MVANPTAPTAEALLVNGAFRTFWDEQVLEAWSDDAVDPPPAQISTDEVVARLRTAVVGYGETIHTPFGPRQLLYADYTASGRLLWPIERYLQQQVMPLYGNTHTTT